MKLISKFSRYYLFNSTVLFILTFILVYFALSWMIHEEVDEELLLNQNDIKSKLYKGLIVNNPPFIEVTRIQASFEQAPVLTDTSIILDPEEDPEPYRQATSYFVIDNVGYKVVVRASLIEKDDLFFSLLVIFMIVFPLMVILLYYVNRKTAKTIFLPFYHNLQKLKSFTLKTGKSLNLRSSNIDEFNELNSALNELAEKAAKEYNILKEFTEDLSHELQTPVSIVKSKLELLLQNENPDEETLDNIRKAYQNIDKLDKINRSLILLSKLESKELFVTDSVRLSDAVNNILYNFLDIAEMKNIKITKEIDSLKIINCNDTLIDILLSNLISNAIKYNFDGGTIKVHLSGSRFNISNTSGSSRLDENKIFERFKKDSDKTSSIGLGLAIVKKICSLYNYKINYSYEEKMHVMEVVFK